MLILLENQTRCCNVTLIENHGCPFSMRIHVSTEAPPGDYTSPGHQSRQTGKLSYLRNGKKKELHLQWHVIIKTGRVFGIRLCIWFAASQVTELQWCHLRRTAFHQQRCTIYVKSEWWDPNLKQQLTFGGCELCFTLFISCTWPFMGWSFCISFWGPTAREHQHFDNNLDRYLVARLRQHVQTTGNTVPYLGMLGIKNGGY